MADSRTLIDMWYGDRHRWLAMLLSPLSGLFRVLVALRRAVLQRKAAQRSFPLPIIVVGNINLGGSGKSPLLIALATRLKQAGYRPGIISRGYGSQAPQYPFLVTSESSAAEAGDEPLMIARATGCPVVIDRNRLAAAEALVALNRCDLILSDDGLQHYRLPRDLEIAVVDGQRLLGNGRLLPAGPLRESARRLAEVDWLLVNGDGAKDSKEREFRDRLACYGIAAHRMDLQVHGWCEVKEGECTAPLPVESRPWAGSGKRVHAVAGIGNPPRFFESLRRLGLEPIPHAFSDHHQFSINDLDFGDDLPVVMTEKDAVKCRHLIGLLHNGVSTKSAQAGQLWFLQVAADVDEEFYSALMRRLTQVRAAGESAQTFSSTRAGK